MIPLFGHMRSSLVSDNVRPDMVGHINRGDLLARDSMAAMGYGNMGVQSGSTNMGFQSVQKDRRCEYNAGNFPQ